LEPTRHPNFSGANEAPDFHEKILPFPRRDVFITEGLKTDRCLKDEHTGDLKPSTEDLKTPSIPDSAQQDEMRPLRISGIYKDPNEIHITSHEDQHNPMKISIFL
jgi:hypothetical protein